MRSLRVFPTSAFFGQTTREVAEGPKVFLAEPACFSKDSVNTLGVEAEVEGVFEKERKQKGTALFPDLIG